MNEQDRGNTGPVRPKEKTAMVFSGGGARIPQLLVLSRNLIRGEYLQEGEKAERVRPDILVGTSAGAINAVAVHGILSGRYSWEEYENDLNAIRNTPFDKGNVPFRTVFTWLPGNVNKGYVFQTRSDLFKNHLLYHTLKDMVESHLGYQKLGDIGEDPVLIISAVQRKTGRTLYFSSRNPAHASLSVVDLLMASTAIPLVFPSYPLEGIGDCVDGGMGSGSIPVEAIAGENCNRVYLVCRQGIPVPEEGGSKDILDVALPDKNRSQGHPSIRLGKKERQRQMENNIRVLDNALFTIEKFTGDLNHHQFLLARSLAEKVYVYIPVLETSYSLINFNKAQQQIRDTLEWSRTHPLLRL